MKKILSAFLLLAFAFFFTQEKKPMYWQDIQNFKKLDQENPPPKDAILLIGSSSFTKWTDVASYFPDKTIINRGFGGSRLTDLNNYADDLLNPYRPKQIIIYCGENDFADDKDLKAQAVVDRFKTFYKKIRARFPKIEVDYISIKYSPSRENLWPQMKEANREIEAFMNREPNAEFIDITKVMQDASGKVRKELFVGDMLHMTPEGYRLWTSVMKPYMK
ncbi:MULTISPECIES: GDSL-type esterase/lipase family protein [Chryseobacterium]|uniref:Lysophospholipase L1-like esterase n=1 Tax=Chryseobacterium camelliae TaxID=1265445 RepID=A0ABU0TF85_9FLAO|nr:MULTISPECIES: GDSL-type esterase/lipase family protein [Chryseobacterium]MDT3406483.1 lysophospholipase L1-like esterase [Pseudacidovorax intermedius]MDQ1095719.1 lysophospholipase L1-like esterase [Chryseobacterium camelliae]MDQ1099655.1 lysophospholipase L1-like esterase [Chryseobacterium sp. SORGH_AS_1048]MDR6087004.1 lysophospholipase L1-like esterase [Chryseobacterium sp. SORGH_AS_0909]MDR6131376.1 lysophospholipase L1-like esterase [Chryseobacterium sp. SORGH_AS_1175]